jgi:hypothetical protein
MTNPPPSSKRRRMSLLPVGCSSPATVGDADGELDGEVTGEPEGFAELEGEAPVELQAAARRATAARGRRRREVDMAPRRDLPGMGSARTRDACVRRAGVPLDVMRIVSHRVPASPRMRSPS